MIRSVAIVMLLLFFMGCNTKQPEKPLPPKKPNIIWLMAEDISLDLACYGTKGVRTPNLDQMAKEGVRYNRCYVTNPICSPSRSAMLLGTHQLQSNTHQHRSNRELPLAEPFRPFTSFLREAGYTCILGNSLVRRKGRKIDVNFKHEALGPWDGVEHFGLFDKYDTIDLKDTPFFAQVELKTSHRGDWWKEVREQSEHPVSVDSIELPPYLADHPQIRLDWATYLDQIEYVDHEVGLILEDLRSKKLLENTIVIFSGDNGRCNIRGKGYLYEAGLKVPLLIRWPDGQKKGTVSHRLVDATDITATVLEAAGVALPEFMTGSPIQLKNHGRTEVYAARDLWDEIDERSRALVTERWKYIRNDRPKIPWDAHQAYLEFYRPALHVMRKMNAGGDLKPEEARFFQAQKPPEELYDLEQDPYELNNLAGYRVHESNLTYMRERCQEYDQKMNPSNTANELVDPVSVPLLEWVKKERPADYERMLSGEEIGFNRFLEEYLERE